MKKLLLLAAFAVLGITANAQEFKGGVSAALPVGDAGDGWNFGLNLEASALWDVADQFQAGGTAGYSHYFGDSDIDDAGFLPVAASGRFMASDDFTIGLDLGYAIGITPSENDGGFYYAPKVQYSITDAIDIVAAYKGISIDGGSFDAITLGVEFGL